VIWVYPISPPKRWEAITILGIMNVTNNSPPNISRIEFRINPKFVMGCKVILNVFGWQAFEENQLQKHWFFKNR
jgi:hypothetical protein